MKLRQFNTSLFFLAILLVGCNTIQNKSGSSAREYGNSKIDSTLYFEFHNSFWVNMHHFLYEKASGRQVAHLMEDGNSFKAIQEAKILNKLDSAQKKMYENAILFYQENLISRSLLRSSELLVSIQKNQNEVLPDSVVTEEFAAQLNGMITVYDGLWQVHRELNNKIIKRHISRIKKYEESVLSKMEKYSGDTLPEGKIRIDISAYANWAGAYTFIRPNVNITISSLDPGSFSPTFIETVFHEGSHTLFSRDSEFRAGIYIQSEEQEIQFPRSLWHASLFYLCGRTVQDELENDGIEYALTMDQRNVFEAYNTPFFRETLDKYLQEQIARDETINLLLSDISK